MTADASSLIGRAKEIEQLEAALASTISGRGGLWLISGEPGIGKTRLVEWLSARAGDAGAEVVWGSCWEAGGAPAYWPWTQVLRGILGDPDRFSRIRQRIGPAIELLVQLLPGHAAVATSAPAGRVEPEQASFQLMDAVARVLAMVAESSPLVVVLEDLHAADSASLLLLDFLGRHLRNTPVLMVGTHRDSGADLADRAPLIWRCARLARTLRPARLGSDDIRRYLEHACGDCPSETIVRGMLERSDGNPLFLAEMVSLVRARGGFGDGLSEAAPTIPDSLHAVIGERLAGLSSGLAELLGSASIIGREFSPAELAAPADGGEAEISALLREAHAAGVAETTDDGGWRFVHMLTCDVIRSSLEPGRRRRLHRQRAEQLMRQPDPPWSEIAHHFEATGGAHDEVVAAWRRAGRPAALLPQHRARRIPAEPRPCQLVSRPHVRNAAKDVRR